jgi:MORN repeat variant
MKYYLSILISGIFIFSACKGESPNEDMTEEITETDSSFCECHQLTFDEAYNHFYRYERRKGFYGKCEEYHPDGSVKLEKNFVDGKVHGKMISYHENGQIWEDQEFDMNFQVGERIIYTKSGVVKFHALYKRGKQIKVIEAKPWLTIED